MKRRPWRKLLIWVAFFTGSLLVFSGCERREEERRRYVPSEEVAQRALETALMAWQKGKLPPCLVQDSSPEIRLVDTHHRAGQKLTAFKVLGPVVVETPSCYAVRLTFEGPGEEVRARYVVLGLDPVWVMRHEDLKH